MDSFFLFHWGKFDVFFFNLNGFAAADLYCFFRFQSVVMLSRHGFTFPFTFSLLIKSFTPTYHVSN